MTKAKQHRPVRELDACVRRLRLTGVDGGALVAAMPGRTAEFRALLDATEPEGLDAVPGRLLDLRHLAALLAVTAAGTRDAAAKAPE